jgi:outer membrane biosynthesis protein TonB
MPYAKERKDFYLNYGEVLMQLGKFEEAKDQFKTYASERPEDPKTASLIAKCERIQAIRPIYSEVELKPLMVLNDSARDEFGLAFYGATGLVFVSDRIAETDVVANLSEGNSGYLNIYVAELGTDSSFLSPRLFSKRLNAPSKHNGPATFSRDGKTVYFSQSGAARPNGGFDLQIMVSKLEGDQWTKPEALSFNLANKIFTHPCLSADGTALYFSSDMPGGQGGTDIWVSYYKGDRWTAPRNLGPKVNTAENESFPFVHPDGTLYFASKGHDGYGGYDLYRCKPMGNGIDWLDAENLGQPFNSGADDTYFLLEDDQTKGFLVSAIAGSDDIYAFQLKAAEAQTLPEGIAARGSSDFLDVVGEEKQKNDEKFVDEMIAKGGKIEEPSPNNTKTDNKTTNPDQPKNNPEPNKTTEKPSKPNKTPDEEFVDNMISGGNNTANPETPNNADKTNHNSETANTNPENSNTETARTNPRPATGNAELTVELRVVDALDNTKLSKAKVILLNELNQQKESFSVNADGTVRLKLQPDQSYQLRAEADGYYGTSLPISTVGAYESQTVSAALPLLKKEDQ